MTRKDFEGLALAMRTTFDNCASFDVRLSEWQWVNMVNNVADYCRATNPMFDRAKFIAACGEYSELLAKSYIKPLNEDELRWQSL